MLVNKNSSHTYEPKNRLPIDAPLIANFKLSTNESSRDEKFEAAQAHAEQNFDKPQITGDYRERLWTPKTARLKAHANMMDKGQFIVLQRTRKKPHTSTPIKNFHIDI